MNLSMYNTAQDIILPSITNCLMNIVGLDHSSCIQQLSDDYTKIHNSKYSMYFKNNELVLVTKDFNDMKEVFMNVDDVLHNLFTSSNL